jgi:hypothetical protein
MTKFVLDLPRIVIVLLVANLGFAGYLASQLNYNSLLNHLNQANIIKLINQQGNISATQRQSLIEELENVSNGGGFSTHNQQVVNYRLLLNINHTVTELVRR